MFCKNCGTELKSGAAFCHQCGSKAGTVISSAEDENPVTNQPVYENVKPEQPARENFVQPTGYIPPMPNYSQAHDPIQKDNSGFAIASLVLGIVSVVLCCCGINLITAILALIFGILGLKSSKRGMAIAGIILSIVAFAFFILFVISYIFELTLSPYGTDFYYNFDEYMYF